MWEMWGPSGKRAGERTDFANPYLCNTRVFGVP